MASGTHVCPWWVAYTFDNALRKLIHPPEKVVGPYVREGMTVADIGCGMGHFSIGMARMVGDTGCVIAADLQQKMLDVLAKRARRAGMAGRIRLHRTQADRIGIDQKVDFALTFAVVHEVPDRAAFLQEVASLLKPGARYLLAEPRSHVPQEQFDETVGLARAAGLEVVETPRIALCLAVLFAKP